MSLRGEYVMTQTILKLLKKFPAEDEVPLVREAQSEFYVSAPAAVDLKFQDPHCTKEKLSSQVDIQKFAAPPRKGLPANYKM